MLSRLQSLALEEELREAAATGNEIKLLELLQTEDVNINSQNSVNGWTALHWACKRGYKSIVEVLLRHGANVHIETTCGETATQLCSDGCIQNILEAAGAKQANVRKNAKSELPIVPNYLRVPVFPFCSQSNMPLNSSNHIQLSESDVRNISLPSSLCTKIGFVVKARLAKDEDFIEIDLPSQQHLTINDLKSILCNELNINIVDLIKIRKLPNTIVRSDRDVQRLRNFEELELIV